MERRRGDPPRPPPPDRPIPPELVARLCETLVDSMAALHALDYRAAGLDDLGKPQGYVERQVTGWTKRYQDARTDDVPDLERTAAWLAANRPAESAGRDLDPQRLQVRQPRARPERPDADRRGARLGDGHDRRPAHGPGNDAGLLDRGRRSRAAAPVHIVGPTTQPGSLSRRELVERYGQIDRAATSRTCSSVTSAACSRSR